MTYPEHWDCPLCGEGWPEDPTETTMLEEDLVRAEEIIARVRAGGNVIPRKVER